MTIPWLFPHLVSVAVVTGMHLPGFRAGAYLHSIDVCLNIVSIPARGRRATKLGEGTTVTMRIEGVIRDEEGDADGQAVAKA